MNYKLWMELSDLCKQINSDIEEKLIKNPEHTNLRSSNINLGKDPSISISLENSYGNLKIDNIVLKKTVNGNSKKLHMENKTYPRLKSHKILYENLELLDDFLDVFNNDPDYISEDKSINENVNLFFNKFNKFIESCTFEDLNILFNKFSSQEGFQFVDNKYIEDKKAILEVLLSDILLDDWEDLISLDRLIFEWEQIGEDKYDKIYRDIENLYFDGEILLLRSTFEDDLNSKGYIIEEKNGKYNIIRLNNNKKINNLDKKNWSKSEIKEILGYDKDIKHPDLLKTNNTYKTRNNVLITPLEYDKKWSEYKEKIKLKKAYQSGEIYKEENFKQIFGLDKSVNKNNILHNVNNDISIGILHNTEGVYLQPKPPSSKISTDTCKKIQDILNISEDSVRSKFNKNKNWERLTANRRVSILENIIEEKIIKWYEYNNGEIDIEDIGYDNISFIIEKNKVNIPNAHLLSSETPREYIIKIPEDKVEINIKNKIDDINEKVYLNKGIFKFNPLNRHIKL